MEFDWDRYGANNKGAAGPIFPSQMTVIYNLTPLLPSGFTRL